MALKKKENAMNESAEQVNEGVSKSNEKKIKKSKKKAKGPVDRKAVRARNTITMVAVILPLVIAFAIFFGMVSYQEVRLRGYDNVMVAVVKKDVPAKTVLTPANTSDYFELREVRKDVVCEGYILDLSELHDTVVKHDIIEKQVMSLSFVESKDSYLVDVKKPVEVSFKVSDASSAVAGSIRSGDRIEIDIINGGVCENVATNVYVKKVFTEEYVEVTSDKGAAVVFVVAIEEAQVDAFLEKISLGGVIVTNAE